MPWTSPPSRFLGAKGATRPRPFLGGFELVAGEIACYRAASLTDASEPLPGRPSDYFRKFFNDSMVNGSAAAMRCGLGVLRRRADDVRHRLPMGSNNGEHWPVEVLDTIRSRGLNAADHELLLGANLHRIMRL